ncbi:MAG: rhodanese-like domain-containing protein [Gordonia sp. (in: high G+C Gram-positive bacteria)]|uniref:rhodanese-like domain-containing protein n=1 Tax=Gordonia sp. (in: high G+C Gram-positive bacteria) TaxID=84139 RepID=UPI003BB76BDF
MTLTLAVSRAAALPATPVVSVTAPHRPLSVRPNEFAAAIGDGAVVVDLRGAPERRTAGALLGALALDLDEALAALSPGGSAALRSATAEARWLLVTDDGHDAEWVAWHLQARGVAGARFLLGGHRALRAARIAPADASDAHEFFS